MPAATTSVNGYLTSTDWTTFNSKQAALVSGTNIKTVNGTTLLGSGDVGTITYAYGGTGQTTVTTGDLLYGSASNVWSKLGIGTTGQILRVVSGAPAWGTDYVGTVTSVSGTGTVNGITLTGTVTSSGNITLGGTLGSIANSQLSNSAVTIGSTSISLGATSTTLAGLTGVTSSAITDSGLTSGRVTYASTSGLLTDSANLQFDGNNLGVGVTPNSWSTGKALEIGAFGNALWSYNTENLMLTQNAYNNAGVYKYGTSSLKASVYQQSGGEHQWYTAPSGTAGNTITFTQAMTLNASGFLGIGTITPTFALEVIRSGTSGNAIKVDSYNNDTLAPAIISRKARGTLASPVAVNAGDILGAIFGAGYAATKFTGNVVGVSGYAEATFTDTSAPTYIRFDTTASGSATRTERARIDSNGQLLVTGGVQAQFTSNSGSYNFYISGENAAGANAILNLSAPGSNSAALTYVRSSSQLTIVNGGSGGVYLASGGVAWIAISDERQKENLIPIVDAITKVSSLRSVTGNLISDPNKKSKAFLIAQDVEKVLPEAVDNSDPEVMGLAYTDVIPLLVAAIKELSAKVAKLETNGV